MQRPRSPTGSTTGTGSTTSGARTPSTSGTRCASSARWPSTERYGRAFMPVTMEAVTPGRPRHRELLLDLGLRGPAGRTPPAGTADHVRPAGPPRPPPAAAAVVQPEGDRAAGGRPADVLPSLIARLDGATTADAADQYAQHIPVHGICIAARHARGRRRPLPRLDLPELPAGAPGQPRPRPGERRDDRVHLGQLARERRRARRRPPDAHRPRRDRRGARLRAAQGRLRQAADRRRHRHDVERHRLGPVALRASTRRRSPASSPSTTRTRSG